MTPMTRLTQTAWKQTLRWSGYGESSNTGSYKQKWNEQGERNMSSREDKHPSLVKPIWKYTCPSFQEAEGGSLEPKCSTLALVTVWKSKSSKEMETERQKEWGGWIVQCVYKLLLLQARVKWSEIKGIGKKNSSVLFVPQDLLEVSLTSIYYTWQIQIIWENTNLNLVTSLIYSMVKTL